MPETTILALTVVNPTAGPSHKEYLVLLLQLPTVA